MMIFPAIRAFSRIGFPAVNLSLVGCARRETHWRSLLPVRLFWARPREIILEFPQPWSPEGNVVTVAVFARKACRQQTLGRLFAYEGKKKEKSLHPGMPAAIDRRLGG